MAKKVLKTKRKATATQPRATLTRELTPARMAIEPAWPMAPKSMRFRRPKRSMVQTEMKEARKYSVPFRAARRRARSALRPMFW